MQYLQPSQHNIINKVLEKYATTSLNQYHEIFAETFTKLICENLNEDAKLNANPFEKIKEYPHDFLMILTKVLNV